MEGWSVVKCYVVAAAMLTLAAPVPALICAVQSFAGDDASPSFHAVVNRALSGAMPALQEYRTCQPTST